ncbi:MAG: tetratricopeptide repeat protein [Deltaproteobacteria bacterium]|nr:tetratricopeptide repeat protein [Deltaproteobacteria bacterium]
MTDEPIDISPDTEDADATSFRIDLDPEKVEQTLQELADRVRKQYERHRYSKVRLSYKGRQLVDDLPIAVFLASEAASFWWLGPLRLLLVNFGMRSFLDVELVNEADDHISRGNAHYLDGEVEEAELAYREALVMRPGDPSALYHLGVLLRVTGRKEEAITTLEEAARWGDHPDAEKANQLLIKMKVRKLIPRPRGDES